MLGEVVAAGGSALLLIADGAAPEDLPPGVEVLDLVADERRVGVHTLLRPHRVWQLWGTSRPYRAVRPWVLWRALRRRLDVVRLDELDHIVIVSVESWPITWQLCRRSSSVTYGWDVPAALFARTPTPSERNVTLHSSGERDVTLRSGGMSVIPARPLLPSPGVRHDG